MSTNKTKLRAVGDIDLTGLANKDILVWDSGTETLVAKSISEILDGIRSAARGDILYRGASEWALLAAGDSGKYFKTLGTGADPMWDTPSGAAVVPNAQCALTKSSTNLLLSPKGSDKIMINSALERSRMPGLRWPRRPRP